MPRNENYAGMIHTLVGRLVAAYAPDRVILFGSHAYGAPTPDSDIDVLVIKNTSAPFLDRLEAVRAAVAGTHPRVPFEPIVLTSAELDRRLNMGDQFLGEIVQRGEVLYAR